MSKEKLFNEFNSISDKEWKEAALKALKGKALETLEWDVEKNIKVYPYYSSETETNSQNTSQYVWRDNTAFDKSWGIQVDVLDNPATVNKRLLNHLTNGANSIGIEKGNLATKLNDIILNIIHLNIKGDISLDDVKELQEVVKRQSINSQACKGSLSADLFEAFEKEGVKIANASKAAYISLQKEVQKSFPLYKSALVNGLIFKESGASFVQELAYTLAKANELIYLMTEEGISIDDASARLKIEFSVGSNYFFEIAKIRAFRRLYQLMIGAYKPEHGCSSNVFIHASTAQYNKSVYDEHNNMLRSTAECMAGILGGADSISVSRFDTLSAETSDFSERIARNVQLLLKEESYLDKIEDPAGGSYYIENITDQLSDQAWKLFQEIEAKGGYIKAFEENSIQEAIEKNATDKIENTTSGKTVVLGVNKFPNQNESIDGRRLHKIESPSGKDFKALQTIRLVEAMELERMSNEEKSMA